MKKRKKGKRKPAAADSAVIVYQVIEKKLFGKSGAVVAVLPSAKIAVRLTPIDSTP